MAGKIVDRLLDLKDRIDLTFTKQLAAEIANEISGQGNKLKNEVTSIILKEIQKEFKNTDKSAILQEALENLEITISFKKKS